MVSPRSIRVEGCSPTSAVRTLRLLGVVCFFKPDTCCCWEFRDEPVTAASAWRVFGGAPAADRGGGKRCGAGRAAGVPIERSIKPISFQACFLKVDDVADDVAGGQAHGRSELASLLLFQPPRTVTRSETQNNVRGAGRGRRV